MMASLIGEMISNGEPVSGIRGSHSTPQRYKSLLDLVVVWPGTAVAILCSCRSMYKSSTLGEKKLWQMLLGLSLEDWHGVDDSIACCAFFPGLK